MIDSLLLQLEERFQKDTLDVFKDMGNFGHENLMKKNTPSRTEHLYKHYKLDVEAIESEFKDFKRIYMLMKKIYRHVRYFGA